MVPFVGTQYFTKNLSLFAVGRPGGSVWHQRGLRRVNPPPRIIAATQWIPPIQCNDNLADTVSDNIPPGQVGIC